MANAELQIDSRAEVGIKTLSSTSSHDPIPQATALGMRSSMGESKLLVERFPTKTLGDGTSLVYLDAQSLPYLHGLPSGSIIGWVPVEQGTDFRKDYKSETFIPIEKFAIILRHGFISTPEGRVAATDIYSASRAPRPGQRGAGLWGERVIGGVKTPEQFDAIAALQLSFSSTEGLEATSMLTRVVSTGKPPTITIAQAGCRSHQFPDEAVRGDLTKGRHIISPMRLTATFLQEMRRDLVIHGRIDGSGNLLPLATNAEQLVIDPSEKRFIDLFVAAEGVAEDNATGFGAGIKPEAALEAILRTTEDMPEIVRNGGTVAQGQQILHNNLAKAVRI